VPPPRASAPSPLPAPVLPTHSGARSGASGALPAPRESAPDPDDVAADLLRDWRAPTAPPAPPDSAPHAPPLGESAVLPSEESPPRPVAELRGAARPFVPHWAPAAAASLEESMEDDGDEWVEGTPPDKRAKIGWAP